MTDEPRDWRARLAAMVDALGQAEVARRMGCSPATVSLLRRGRYPEAAEGKWHQRFLDAFDEARVDCPVLGEIDRRTCAAHRSRPFAATNPVRVRLYRTCPTCPHHPQNTEEP